MDNFSNKVQVFLDYFIHHDGYKTVLLGLRNTAEIAMLGLLIGIVFGTVIATTRVSPRTNPVAKFFNGLSGLYVGLFRGTPIVVQLLVFYYVLMPLMNLHMNSVAVAVVVFGMNSAAYISEIMRAGILSKETSVVSFVGAMDLYVAFNRIGSNSYEFMIPYLVMALIYIVIVLVITLGIKLMERSLRKSDKGI